MTGNVKDGFVAQFVPDEVGPYIIGVEYNNVPVGGTPFTGKAYDSNNVIVSAIPWGTIGKSLEFTVDASRAGEGNLEITIAARGRNIPTQVHPQGSARFAVSFVPLEATDHVINITFNKDVYVKYCSTFFGMNQSWPLCPLEFAAFLEHHSLPKFTQVLNLWTQSQCFIFKDSNQVLRIQGHDTDSWLAEVSWP